MPGSSRPGAGLQNRCPKHDSLETRFQTSLGKILAAQMAPKSKSEGGPDMRSDVHQSQIEKKKALACFVHTLSTWRSCNLTVKTQLILKIFTSSFLSHLFAILAHEGLEHHFKLGVQDIPKPFQNTLRSYIRLGNASGTASERFWTPKWLPKRGP